LQSIRKPEGPAKSDVVLDECGFYRADEVELITLAAQKLSEDFGVTVAVVNLSHIGTRDEVMRLLLELFAAWFPEEKGERALLFLQVDSSHEFLIRDTQGDWLSSATGQNVLFSPTWVRFSLQPKIREYIDEYEGNEKPEQLGQALAFALDECHSQLRRRRMHDWFELFPHGLALYSFFLTPFPTSFFLASLFLIIANRKLKNWN
jgi:hypothetical protein